MTENIKTYEKPIYLFLAIFFFIYVLIRTLLLGITFDEAWTIGAFSHLSFLEIYNCDNAAANNHLLNSFLIKSIYELGWKTTFSARVPNLIAMLTYLYFSFRICQQFFKPVFGICLYFLLIANPFILDFFGLARGYGLAMGFLMGSVFFLLEFWKTKISKFAYLSLSMGCLSVLSNFAFLFYWCALFFAIHFVSYGFKKDFKKLISLISLIARTSIISFVFSLIIYFPIKKLRATDSFWYGGDEGFYQDTLFSLTSYSMGNWIESRFVIIVLNVLLVFFMINVVFYFLGKNKTGSVLKSNVIILLMLLTIPMILNIIAHHYFDTKYLINRTALFFIPLFMMSLVLLIQENKFGNTIVFMKRTLIAFSFLTLINFSNNLNFYTTITWFYDSRIPEILEYINEKGKEQNKVLILDSTVMFSSSLSYYQWKRKYKYVVYARDQPDNLDQSLVDYFLYLEKPLDDVSYDPSKEEVTRYPREIILRYEKEGISLLSNLK